MAPLGERASSRPADRYSSYSMSQRRCPEWNLPTSHAAQVQMQHADIGRGPGGVARMEIERWISSLVEVSLSGR